MASKPKPPPYPKPPRPPAEPPRPQPGPLRGHDRRNGPLMHWAYIRPDPPSLILIPGRSSDRRRPPVIHLSRLPRVRSSSAVRWLDSLLVRRTYHQSGAANGAHEREHSSAGSPAAAKPSRSNVACSRRLCSVVRQLGRHDNAPTPFGVAPSIAHDRIYNSRLIYPKR